MEKIDIRRYRELEDEGYLIIQQHPEADLLIHNYSQKTQFERFWVPETLQSRGLITRPDGLVIARPFPKFFNVGEREEAIPNESFEVYEKLDGSLGILYFFEGQPRIATRGSFTSEQSQVANRILQRKYGHVSFDPSITYLFEIIYPDNRIVVDYGDLEDLILIGMVETATGRELSLVDIGLPIVKKYDGIKDIEVLAELEEDNREGFVIRFESGLRLKFKFDEYVRLHRILTQISPIRIWEMLRDGGTVDDMVEDVPDEFFGWMKEVAADLQAQYRKIENEAKAVFKVLETRKETAAYFLTQKHDRILFRMLDGKTYDDIIWKMIRDKMKE